LISTQSCPFLLPFSRNPPFPPSGHAATVFPFLPPPAGAFLPSKFPEKRVELSLLSAESMTPLWVKRRRLRFFPFSLATRRRRRVSSSSFLLDAKAQRAFSSRTSRPPPSFCDFLTYKRKKNRVLFPPYSIIRMVLPPPRAREIFGFLSLFSPPLMVVEEARRDDFFQSASACGPFSLPPLPLGSA